MAICYEGTLTSTSIWEPLYLGDKSITRTLEDLDESYGPNYRRSPRFQKMESHIQYMLLWIWCPNKKDFWPHLYERTKYDCYDIFYETLDKVGFMLRLLISLKLLFIHLCLLSKSRCFSDPKDLLTYEWFSMPLRVGMG